MKATLYQTQISIIVILCDSSILLVTLNMLRKYITSNPISIVNLEIFSKCKQFRQSQCKMYKM